MKLTPHLLVLVALVAGQALGQNDLDPEAMLAAHNQVRQNLNSGKAPTLGLGPGEKRPQPVPKPPLPVVKWDERLAADAADYAKQCVFEHAPNPGRVGENLYLHSNEEALVASAEVVYSWSKEAEHYDYSTNSCQAGHQCGHYTQLVWSSLRALGCGVSFCDNIPNWGPGGGQIWVCRYSPAGNIVGRKPY